MPAQGEPAFQKHPASVGDKSDRDAFKNTNQGASG
jgi:hypothetical protein